MAKAKGSGLVSSDHVTVLRDTTSADVEINKLHRKTFLYLVRRCDGVDSHRYHDTVFLGSGNAGIQSQVIVVKTMRDGQRAFGRNIGQPSQAKVCSAPNFRLAKLATLKLVNDSCFWWKSLLNSLPGSFAATGGNF